MTRAAAHIRCSMVTIFWDAVHVEGDQPSTADAARSRFTTRLRLEPVDPAKARDLWLVHNDDEVSYWYGKEKPSLEDAERWARFMGDSWRFHGVHKWIAYDRVSGDVVGRGGIVAHARRRRLGPGARAPPAGALGRVAHGIHHPFTAHANWLEIGWALRRKFWGLGYAI